MDTKPEEFDTNNGQGIKPAKQLPRLIGNSLVGFFDAVTVRLLICVDVINVKNNRKGECERKL